MASVNKVTIIGNLGRDPEIRYMPSGEAIANLAAATSYRSKDRNTSEYKELTEWHRITLFGQSAEYAGKYAKKGSSIYVEGRLQTRKYTDKDGIERYATDIIGENFQLLGGRQDGQQQGGQQQSGGRNDYAEQTGRSQPQQRQQSRPPADDFDSDSIPF